MSKKPRDRSEELPLTKRERQIMDVSYRHEEMTAREIWAELPDAPSYSTVRTLLTLLVKKGHLKCSTKDRAHVYRPARQKSVAAESALRRLIRTFFDGSVANAVSGLLSMKDHSLTQEEFSRLERLIAESKNEEPK